MSVGNPVDSWSERLAARPALLFTLLASVTFALRLPALGDWNFEIDDQWYALVGHRLLAGDLLYVDIFDRKGPALYLTFAGLALFGTSVVPYQIVAGLCASWAAYLCARVAIQRAGATAGIAASLLMVALVFAHGGANAQTPVFYNALVLLAAHSVVARFDLLRDGMIDRRLIVGFLAAGLAIAFKMSVVFEAIYFGLIASALMWQGPAPRGQVSRNIAVLALAGAAPMLLAGAYYFAIGHFAEFWHAIVQSNFDRTYFTMADRLNRVVYFLTMIGLPLALFVGSVALQLVNRQWYREDRFLAGWALVAIAAILVFPAFYSHHALTTLAPLCIGMAPFLKRSRAALLVALAFAPLAVVKTGEFNPAEREHSRRVASSLVEYVGQELGDGELVVWGSPSYLHVLVGKPPLTVLAFPPHLYHRLEAGAGGRDERAEVARMFAQRPHVVVVQTKLAQPHNAATMAAMWEYVGGCRRVRKFTTFDHFGEQVQNVYSRCGEGAASLSGV